MHGMVIRLPPSDNRAYRAVQNVAQGRILATICFVVADEGWGIPDSHRAAFDMLAAHGVCAPALATELSAAAGMRKRIAHGYASIDHERLWGDSERAPGARRVRGRGGGLGSDA